MSLRMVLVAGEASGDLLGAGLARELKRQHPGIELAGVTGPAMREAGVETWYDIETLSVMGLFEVLRHLPRLLRLRRELRRRVLEYRPSVFIGIDAPDFNLGLERQLKEQGLTTVHYVSPSVWAWRQGRVKGMARAMDRLLALFPFEPDFYRDHGIDARFVGHPLADDIDAVDDPGRARAALGLDPTRPVLGLLPGSRMGEVSRIAPAMLEAAALLVQQQPDLQVQTAMASQATAEHMASLAAAQPGLELGLELGKARQLMAASDLLLVASGTATLEALLVNRPMVVCYKLQPATYQLARSLKLVKTEHISLPNILAGEGLVPELIQDQASGAGIAAAAGELMGDTSRLQHIRQRFDQLHESLARDASREAARSVLELAGG